MDGVFDIERGCINREDVLCIQVEYIQMMKHMIRSARRAISLRAYFSQVTEATKKSDKVSHRDHLQFSKRRLVDFGELPHGEIPTALQYSKPSSLNKLANGVTVATETYVGNQAAITVAVKVGSRQETIANSSVSQFVSRLAFRGSKSKSRTDQEKGFSQLGGEVEITNTREMTYFTLFVDKSQVEEALALLADGILNPSFESDQIEAVKPQIHKNASSMDPEKSAHEGIHYTSFRDHALGQPSHGIRDNVYSITADQIKQFHEKYYVGENIVVAGAGDINATQFSEAAAKAFGNARAKVEGPVENSEQPYFTPSLMFQRDDELPNTTTATAFVVPGRNHPDFFALNYFKRIIGEFRVDKHTGAHLNSAKLQYNSLHTDLGDFCDIVLQKPFYFSYSDVGLFGNFFFGNQIWNKPMLLLGQNKMSEYAQYIQPAEVFRARNTYWNELLERDCPVATSHRIANQAAYLGRLVNRTEVATRISHMDPNYIQNTASKHFWDKETSIFAWGPLHNSIGIAHYVRRYKRATLGEYSIVKVKYDY